MPNINNVIDDISRMDTSLAGHVRDYVRTHPKRPSYGLVFEDGMKEYIRLYGKNPCTGDTVETLTAADGGGKSKGRWTVSAVDGDTVSLKRGNDEKDVPLRDVVPVAGSGDIVYPGLKIIDRIERGGSGNPYHMVINAENYHALEVLSYTCGGKVDCIYIDPPYNTGAKDWKYNNNYVGQEDQYRHSKWLAFMNRRLILSKRLLNASGSILIVSIDEKEVNRLGMLLEQVFPEARIQMVSTVINHASVARTNEFNRNNEYLYFVMLGNYSLNPIDDSRTSTAGAEVSWNTLRRHSPSNLRATRPRQFYPVYINKETCRIEKIGDPITPDVDRHSVEPVGGCAAVFPVRDDGTEMLWGVVPSELERRASKGYVRIGKYMPDKPQQFSIQVLPSGSIKDIEEGRAEITGRREDGSVIAIYRDSKMVLPKTQWDYRAHDAKTYGSNILRDIFKDARFAYPKSVYAVMDCLKIAVGDKKDALIVDFFAGSGTTLHAVNLLNAQDGGHRRCICVTNNEVSAAEERSLLQRGLRPSDGEWRKCGIAYYVTWLRTKCSIDGVDIDGAPLEGNYGCDVESYDGYDGDIFDPDTGKKVRGRLYRKVKRPAYPELSAMRISDGFRANAVFCELTYESPWGVRLGAAFSAIAPILWAKAGCRGDIISHTADGYSVTDYYGVLFNYGAASDFCAVVKKRPSIRMVFIVTDSRKRFSDICGQLGGVTVYRLYESYLKTFQIYGEGVV